MNMEGVDNETLINPHYNKFNIDENLTGLGDMNTSQNGTSFANGTEADFYVPPGIVVLLSTLYGTISVIAFVGNSLVIIVIFRNKRMQSVTNMFICDMAIADVIIAIFGVPFQFQAALLQRWVLPHIMCPVAPFVTALSVNISVFSLAVIAVDRYRAVLHPLKPKCSSVTFRVVTIVLWVVGIGSVLPYAIFFRITYIQEKNSLESKPFCKPFWPESIPWFPKYYHIYMIVAQYGIPLIIISFAYFRIGCHIFLSKTPGFAVDRRDEIINRNKKKLILLENQEFIDVGKAVGAYFF
ncbi:unnamed protein product [Owenia fusiformis]|uniref:Uncharacterized protein n=1 Tax=Owenia fusiformis TaxID=6347 RepID=A0A8J1U9B2_OWEFU|nr:unnamed protein product [Owenia fusiformis]